MNVKTLDLHVPISERDHQRGAADAAVTLVEYGDFDCPYCAAAYPEVRKLLGHVGPVLRFVFRHNPRGELHPNARIAAHAAEAAALQGQFWPMHDTLFEHSKALDEAALVSYATALGLDPRQFSADLNSEAIYQRVRADEVGGLRSGVVGTPTFFINGHHFRDKPDFESLTDAIERAAERVST